MSKLKVAFFLLNILLSTVTSMDIASEVYFDHKSDYSGLPNEIPTLFGMGILRNDQEDKRTDWAAIRKYVYDNQEIIGALPMPEQIAFLESLSSPNNLNIGKLNGLIKERKIYEKEVQSFRDFLEDYEKQMPYGLGAIQYTANKYVYKSDYNQNMHNIIYSEIAEMIKAQQDEINNKLDLFDKVQQFLLKNRETIYIQAASGTTKLEVSVDQTDKEQVVNTFLKYFVKHEKFTQELHKHGLKAEIALANMDGCRNYNSPERHAGQSSTYLEYPKISYKKGKKPIAINGDDLVGIENRTSNGFEIFKGFFPGESVRHNDGTKINSFVPRAYEDQITKISTFLQNSQADSVIGSFIKTFNETIYQDNVLNLYKSGIIEEFKDLYQIDLNKKCKTNNYFFYYNIDNVCKYKDFSLDQLTDCTTEYKSKHSGSLLLICEEREYPNAMFYSKNGADGEVTEIEAFSMNKTYDEILKKVYQGCFGVFTSGGKRDKDACRDVMNKKCGIDLDYHAKKLGLYDYINSNPSSYDFSGKKAKDITGAYGWISSHFFINDIALKPSSLTGTSLILQKDGEEFKGYLEDGEEAGLQEILGIKMKVLGCNNIDCEKNDGDDYGHIFKVYMNKANHFILENSGGSLKFNLFNAIFIIGILFLF